MSCDQKVELRHNAPENWAPENWAPENWSPAALVMPRADKLALEAGKLLDEARTALDRDLGAAIRAAAKLVALLGGNCGEMPSAVPARGGLAPWQQRKVRDHIARHLETSISVEDLAKLVSLSAGHFCRGFKESFGDTPHAYIIRMRLELAQELMLASPEPLSQIALACGHSDQAHFTRRFRKQTGETPNAWRRRHAMGDWLTPSRETNFPVRAGLPDEMARTASAGLRTNPGATHA
jgi:AraC family transcriptional regulator